MPRRREFFKLPPPVSRLLQLETVKPPRQGPLRHGRCNPEMACPRALT